MMGVRVWYIAQQLRSNKNIPKLFKKVGILGPAKPRMESALSRVALEVDRTRLSNSTYRTRLVYLSHQAL